MKKILVIGAGSWGTAIANLLAKNSHQVFLSANHQSIIDEINNKSTNKKFLPEIKLNSKITAIADFSEILKSCDLVFIVIPSLAAADVFKKISKVQIKKSCKFVICSKGVDKESLLFLGELFEKVVKNKNYAVLSGPNFAIEVANEVPTITTIAAKNKNLAKEVIEVLRNKNFHPQYFKDPITAEVCGVVKNIIAIACGMVDGLDLGVNAKAAIVLKGIGEIQTLCKKLGSSTDVVNAAGFGDIFLTCSSSKSRNNSLGTLLAEGKSYAEISKSGGKTFEGAASALSISKIAAKLNLQLDLCEKVQKILTKKHTSSQIKSIITKLIIS